MHETLTKVFDAPSAKLLTIATETSRRAIRNVTRHTIELMFSLKVKILRL
jgi:hypothetical protein